MNMTDDGIMSLLDELGWHGVPALTAFSNIMWLYLAAGLDPDVPLRLIANRGIGARACCGRAALAMAEEARRVGVLDVLRRPRVLRPAEALALLERVYGGNGKA